MLTKSKRLVDVDDECFELDDVDDGESLVYSLVIRRADYVDMGEPDQLTITVEPGNSM